MQIVMMEKRDVAMKNRVAGSQYLVFDFLQ